MRFLCFRRPWLAIALLKLAMTNFGAHAMCSDFVTNKALPRGRALFTYYDSKIHHLAMDKQAAKEFVSKARIEEFWLRTWPELQTKARAEEMSVAEMLEEPLLLAKLYTSELLPPKKQQQIAILQNGWIKDIQALEKMKPGGKLKANHWERIPRIMAGLYSIIQLAFEIERVSLPEPTFDPVEKLSVNLIMHVLESMDDSVMDAMALSVEEIRRLEQAKTASKDSPAPVPPLGTDAEPSLTMELPLPELSLAPMTAREIEIEEQTNQLLVVLKERSPLSASIAYSAKNPKGDEFTIEISPGIVAEDSGPESHNIRRLLKSILHGTGGRSGIKLLSSIGPNIVELKAYISGHKRLIGCLEGRKLRLLKYGSMPDSLAGYVREIPANLCQ